MPNMFYRLFGWGKYGMPIEDADHSAHIEIIIRNSDPLDLLNFTSSLTALAREHQAQLRLLRPDLEPDETRLLIRDVRKGSILLELAPALAPFVSSMEIANTSINFVKHIKSSLSALNKPGGRIQGATTAQLKNMGDTVHAIMDDANGNLTISARYKNGDIEEEFTISRQEAIQIYENSAEQRREIEDRSSAQFLRVLMRLHQSSVEDMRIGKRTSEKGIVEHIDMIPRTLVYASDIAGQKIKNEITSGSNPFQKGFIVDLDVETVGGKPRLYRIVDVHEIVDLGDGE